MKKLLLCLVCFLMAFTATAYAQMEKPTIDSETGIIELSGISSIQNGDVSVIITKPGVLLGDINLSGIKDQTVIIYSLPTAADGSFSGQCKLPARFAATYGNYMVYVTGEAEQKFYYADPDEITNAVNAVDGATADTLEGILTEYTVTKEILAINLSGDYVTYTDTPEKSTLFHSAMVSHIALYSPLTIANITEAFDKALETSRYAYGDAAEVKKAITDNKLGVTVEASLIDDIAAMYAQLRTKSIDSAVIAKEVRIAEALVKINAATKGDMVGIISSYNDVLSLTLTGDYETVDKVEVNKPLLEPTFTNLAAFQTAFANSLAAEVAKKNNIGNNTPSGGGGGGGGAPTSSVIIKNDTEKDDETEEDTQKEDAEKDDTNVNTSVSYFTDLGTAVWAENYVNALAEKKIIAGVGNGQFAPLDIVSREEYLTMLIKAFGVKAGVGKVEFADVKDTDWFAPYVVWGVENGIVYGVDSENFGAGSSISREQMAVMTVRMMEKFGIELSGNQTQFSDGEMIADYAKDAVAKMQEAKIINGMPDGSFAPKDSLSRAQAATVIYQMMRVGGLDV